MSKSAVPSTINVRDEKLEKRYNPRELKEEDVPPDYVQLLSVLCSVLGLMMKVC
jgi:hypothetical protein